ncbi:MAG: NAD(P)-dependent glycerol-3-phosphate dehydrogenase [Oscillospiraceae bacterium]|nr:NAD(P)-dependent glycerol-3-phosphate dehydrogenase [Oscillospiraceae bacterium]
MANIFILGCGFGSGLAALWAKAGHNVTAYSNNAEEIAILSREREHKKLLPGVVLPKSIRFTNDISNAKSAEIIVFAVPSKFIGQAAKTVAPRVSKNAVVISVSKGFSELKCDCDSGVVCRMSEVIGDAISDKPIVVLTGPCHAEEVGNSHPTAVVAACENQDLSEYTQTTLQTKTFRIYVNRDVIGCELGGALKNPIALCCGIAHGMGLKDNASAALMTRGLAEIKRLGTAYGAECQTFSGLAGVGDLIVTCTSEHSRNNRAGRLIGQGVSAEEAIQKVGTVEGYECVEVALKLAREKNVYMPIFEQLYKICYENLSPQKALENLMSLPQGHEQICFW